MRRKYVNIGVRVDPYGAVFGSGVGVGIYVAGAFI